jgi:hypothetical protein
LAGIYFGTPRGFGSTINGDRTGFNTDIYSAEEVRQIILYEVIPLKTIFMFPVEAAI